MKNIEQLDEKEILVLHAEILDELERRKAENKLSAYDPFDKQKEFHAAGKDNIERLLCAGNQLGKTYCGSAEVAMHLTGQYPRWWQGRVYDRPIECWVLGETADSTRDTPQRYLIGNPSVKGEWGQGWIPADCLGKCSMIGKPANCIDTMAIKHISGGWSELAFKSYGRGRERLQARNLDLVWFDEEPPIDVYSECITRTQSKRGMVMITFTPLKGMSEVVRLFIEDGDLGAV